jgi:hypothetical protein
MSLSVVSRVSNGPQQGGGGGGGVNDNASQGAAKKSTDKASVVNASLQSSDDRSKEAHHTNSNKYSGKRPIKSVEKLTSMVFMCGLQTNGSVLNSENMMGKYVHNLESCDDDVLAFSNYGLYNVNQAEPVSNIKFITAKSGKTFTAGLSSDGEIYTWGTGQTGELGLGLLYQQLEGPMKVQVDTTFIELSAGQSHVVAVDTNGNAYAWGQVNASLFRDHFCVV